jgi:hypothetical protein
VKKLVLGKPRFLGRSVQRTGRLSQHAAAEADADVADSDVCDRGSHEGASLMTSLGAEGARPVVGLCQLGDWARHRATRVYVVLPNRGRNGHCRESCPAGARAPARAGRAGVLSWAESPSHIGKPACSGGDGVAPGDHSLEPARPTWVTAKASALLSIGSGRPDASRRLPR